MIYVVIFITYHEKIFDICMSFKLIQIIKWIFYCKRRLQWKRQNTSRKRCSMYIVKGVCHDLGKLMDQLCLHCNARFWMGEKDILTAVRLLQLLLCAVLVERLNYHLYLFHMILYTSSGSEPNFFLQGYQGLQQPIISFHIIWG